MKIKFTKMHGLGNDFVVLDAVHQSFIPTSAQARYLADRHFGVGCDQILVVEEPTQPGVDFRYRIFNADGGEVEQCGNGARCFARFVHDRGLTEKREIRVETKAGIIAPRLEADGQVTVDMGVPRLTPGDIPFESDSSDVAQPLQVADKSFDITAVSMGNPARRAVGGRCRRFPGRQVRSADRVAPALSASGQCRLHGGDRSPRHPAARV